jgi:glycosyltransferase involved in cell wall biosynthesis
MKIVFLVPYPLKKSPSQRFRFEQYFDALVHKGHTLYVQSFLGDAAWDIIYLKGHRFRKILAVINGFMRRLAVLSRAASADFVFIHREAAPVGPPVFEWIIGRLLKRKIIYDFDDAIWQTDQSNESDFVRAMRYRSKAGSISQWAYIVSCGNEYLCNYAKQFNTRVVYNPTTIDTSYHISGHKPKTEGQIVIGWTGSHSTLKYLTSIGPALRQLQEKYPQMIFEVIADRAPELSLPGLQFTKWNIDSEIADLGKFDIGIMPLPNDDWARGKCGFKALQYMAMGIPTVASPVGVNTTIIQHGVNGFLCETDEDWFKSIDQLIRDPQFRLQMGKQARDAVEKRYSVKSNTSNFLAMFG